MVRERDRLEVAVPETAEHGEGPVWDRAGQRLLWVDLMAGLVHAFAPASGARQSWWLGRDVGCVAPLQGGGMVAGVREGFALLDEASGLTRTLAEPLAHDSSMRMNDGACDPVGRFWAGSMAYDERPGAGSLYRLDPDGTVSEVLSGVTISNGLGWSPDGTACYYIDSGTAAVDRFNYRLDDGTLGDRSRLVDVPRDHGTPDGMTVDADGCLWVALWTGGRVQRFDPTGRLLETWSLPVARVTSCAFGGPRLDTLFITTSRYGLSPGELVDQPLAGAVFAANPGVTGLPAPPCGYGTEA